LACVWLSAKLHALFWRGSAFTWEGFLQINAPKQLSFFGRSFQYSSLVLTVLHGHRVGAQAILSLRSISLSAIQNETLTLPRLAYRSEEPSIQFLKKRIKVLLMRVVSGTAHGSKNIVIDSGFETYAPAPGRREARRSLKLHFLGRKMSLVFCFHDSARVTLYPGFCDG
jgi:hypothetical protein